MSKPKPGLGKVVRRTLVQGSQSASCSNYTSLQLTPTIVSTSHYSSSSSASSSGVNPSGPSYVGNNNARRDFSSLGLPTASPSSSPSSSSSSSSPGTNAYSTSNALGGTSTSVGSSSTSPYRANGGSNGIYGIGSGGLVWDNNGEGDIVKPFRSTTSYNHNRSNSPPTTSIHPQSSPSSPSSSHSPQINARRSLSTFSPSTPWYPNTEPSFFSSLPSLPNIPWSSFPLLSNLLDKPVPPWLNSSNATNIYDIIPSSPPPSIRPNGRNGTIELHSALSPYSGITSSSDSSSTLLSSPAGFTNLGIPHHSTFASSSSSTNTPPIIGSTTNQLIFHLGASGLAKERPAFKPNSRRNPPPPPPHRPRSFPLPKVTPPQTSELRSVGVGEDAYFARIDGMCIADGVGGWASSGRGGAAADAGRWSRLLTHFCEVELGLWGEGKGQYGPQSFPTGEGGSGVNGTTAAGGSIGAGGNEGWTKKVWEAGGMRFSTGNARGKRKSVDPVEIMQRGYEKCLSCFTAEGIHGSSTCLLALLHNSTLSVANLGDCCLLLIRNDEIIFRTDEMQHAFNFPLQLGTHSRDEPMKDAKRYDVGVSKGDVVVLGSDGLMDNLFDEDILETLAQFTPDSNTSADAFSPQKVSEELCRRAREVSEQVSATTPFMVRAIEEGIDFVGGKRDDISVVVGVIGDREGEENGLSLRTQ